MKLIFISHINNFKNSSGVINKIYSKSKFMNKHGILYKTYIIYKEHQKDEVINYEQNGYIEFVPVSFYGDETTRMSRYSYIRNLYKTYRKISKKAKGNYDYIYVRMNPINIWFAYFLFMFRNKVIVEHNTMEIPEYLTNGKHRMAKKSKIFGKYIRKFSKAFVAVCEDVLNYQNDNYEKNKNVKSVLIPNGIEVENIKLREEPLYNNKDINLLFVGNISQWHGLERLIEGINNYNGDKNITLNIIGPTGKAKYLSKMVEEYNLGENVKFLGYKNKNEMNNYFNSSHLAVGSLGLYKLGFNDASPLKSREYLSRGIPFIFSGNDPDLKTEYNNKFYLQVPNDNSAVDIQLVIDFVSNIYNEKNSSNRLREYAKKNMDYDIKMLKLKEFINNL